MSEELYPKIEKPAKGKWLKILVVIILSMLAIFTFFEPVWGRLMEIIVGG